MMLKSVFVFLCLVIQAHPQTPEVDDFSGEIDYAGIGSEKPTVAYEDMDDLVSPPFISNETVPIIFEEAENTTYDTNTEPMITTTLGEDETTLTTGTPIYTITTADTTQAYPTTTPLETTTEPMTTAAPTVTTKVVTTTHAPTTTEPTTTTKVPTTTTKLPTTTTRTTTKKFSTTPQGPKKTTQLTKPFLTTTPRPSTTTSATFNFPDPKAPQCSFMDVDFSCEEPIVCYGEGEIDCSETFEEIIPEATITISKSTSESDSSDSDYDDSEAETIEYPPELVGRVSPKQRPFLFKMQEFDTTTPSASESDDDEDSSSSTKTTIRITIGNGDVTSHSSTSEKVLSIPFDESTTSSTSSASSKATTQIIIQTETTSSDSDESEMDTKPISGTTESTSVHNVFTEKEDNVLSTPSTPQNESEVTLESAFMANITESEDFSAAFIDDSSEVTTKKAHLINKRSENNILSSGSESSSSSMSVSLRVAALESPNQKIRVGRCRITGTMYCTPSPTVGNCRGRTLCQVVSSTAETSEKSTSAKGVENWAIAVIAICAIAAALTVSLLIYLVFTSWKKLKVQPHNGVTTLNYVNSTPP